jgi:hypothetical protein
MTLEKNKLEKKYISLIYDKKENVGSSCEKGSGAKLGQDEPRK